MFFLAEAQSIHGDNRLRRAVKQNLAHRNLHVLEAMPRTVQYYLALDHCVLNTLHRKWLIDVRVRPEAQSRSHHTPLEPRQRIRKPKKHRRAVEVKYVGKLFHDTERAQRFKQHMQDCWREV